MVAKLSLIVLIAIFGLLTAPFLGVLDSRLAMLMGIFLLSFTPSLVKFSKAEDKKQIRLFVLALMAITISMVLVYPILLGPTKFLEPNFVTEDHLLYNFSIERDTANNAFIFQSQTSHHAYYPLSYIYAKIFFDLTGNAWLIQVVLMPAISVFLFVCLASLLINRVKNLGLSTIVLIAYCICLFLITYFFNGVVSFWNFRTIGYLVIPVLLIAFMRLKNYRPANVVMAALLVPSVILTDSVFLPIGVALFLFYLFYLTRDKKLVSFISLSIIIYVAYQVVIGFFSYLNYGDYLLIAKAQLLEFLDFDFSSAISSGVINRSTLYPVYDNILIASSHLMIYGLLSFILLLHFTRKVGWFKLMPLWAIFVFTNVFNIGARLMPNVFVNNVGSIFTYSYMPFLMLSLGYYLAFWINKKPSDIGQSSDQYGSIIKKSFKRGKYFWLIILVFIIFFSSVNTTFYAYPKSVNDPVEYIDDARVVTYDTHFMATFLNNYWSEDTAVYYHVTSHLQERYLKEVVRQSWWNSTYGSLMVIDLPQLPTIYADKAALYERMNSSDSNIVYSQEKWSIITKPSV